MKMWKCLAAAVLALLAFGAANRPDQLTIARLKYSGGGDWYSNPTSLPNLLQQLRERLGLDTAGEEAVVAPADPELFSYPLVYMNGHGTVRFSEQDINNLREFFRRGGVLWADDNYGMDPSFRKEIARVLPDHPLQEIPFDHPVFSIYYVFERGLPKIHEHDGGPPTLYGIYLDGRLAVFYTFNTDIGDGLESEGVHPQDSPEIREQAMQMAINLVLFVLSS
ncbi:MAG TPA: DUF4159 domain-containing protein [bacterium]|nr:DUF4159 domain-containing protein [Candidatus Omnitrophota bacterium]HOJ59613.1 DUF4159 domain-containing protein [bacterium]HOL95812.1 DUF4159 domain-containing protein [bacterium]HPP01770.1 DUF4159 domain-containing protein [bacterium]HXK93220.1 DUF4159 domain-containing protein [bacterium]